MAQTNFTPKNKELITTEFGIFTMMFFLATGAGFWLMGNQGTFREEGFLGVFLLFITLNAVFIGFSALFLFFQGQAGRIFVYLHNLDWSWIQNNGAFELEKGTVMYKIFNSFYLSFLFWVIFLSPLLLLQFALPRETAILLLPVVPQIVFPLVLVTAKLFFTIFPASTGETGILAMFNSFISTGIFKALKDKQVSAWVNLIVISIMNGFMWLFVHGAVAQGRELNQLSHFAFGVEQGFLMALTGSSAPAFALHVINLLFWGIQDLVGGNEFIRIGVPVTLFLVWVGGIVLVLRLRKK
jgi:hypothetical protein